MKYGSITFIVLGSILTLTLIGAIVGLPMLIAALWVFLRARKNTATIETVYQEYVATRGLDAAAAAGSRPA